MVKPYIIGITGGSGSGKTHFLNGLMGALVPDQVCFICQDNYYKLRNEQETDSNGVQNFDKPEAIDHEAFARDIRALQNGKAVERLEYTFNNEAKKPKMLVFEPKPVVIIEGIFVMYFPEIAKLLDLKVFIEADDFLKLKRRIIRDNKERGYDLEDVLYRYEHHVMPAYERYINPLKKYADFIIPNHYHFDRALQVLITFIRCQYESR